ncbi:hypothetical protein [Deinococcus budaensis]|uniref:Uncharacterized protein n=1 Tax=Deinococcus budaensis TaxID=1665626 RepID=A0A7W8GHN7_9DEIO|nr:hypothetical protein [Deinococcus budaensis]MBB5235839.1 hypothetical protein [Deinococcus budaensis]
MTPAPGVVRALLREIRAAGGATFGPSGQPADPGDRWLFPRHPGRTLILEPAADWEAGLRAFLQQHGPLLGEGGCGWAALGAWIHPGGCLYLDIVAGCRSRDRAVREALRAGRREGRPVAAIYQASSGQTLTLPPPG